MPKILLLKPEDFYHTAQIVLIDAKSSVRKQIVRELEIMHECHSEYIISCFGSYLAEPNICICMEFMDKGSFDGIYKQIGAIDIEVVSKVALSVLEGLTYLYDVHRIIHRGKVFPHSWRVTLTCLTDIKPSNILCNSEGAIKLIDFGVSGELINSIANTFVGTSIYMSVHLFFLFDHLLSLTFPHSPNVSKALNIALNPTSGPLESPLLNLL